MFSFSFFFLELFLHFEGLPSTSMSFGLILFDEFYIT